MNTILIDDEQFSLQYLEKICLQIPGIKVRETFLNAQTALGYIESNDVDLIITDIEMPGLSGMEAIRKVRGLRPGVGVIFVTGYEQYALEAFQVDAVAYITKPCSTEELTHAIDRAKMLRINKKPVEIRTFGMFSVAIDEKPCYFSNSKAKELLALLVDRNGSVVSMEQAIDVLWEERSYDDMVKRLYRKAISYLNHMFDGTGFFVSERAKCYIVPEKCDCDYYRFLKNPIQEAEFYDGEYMSQYSWAEFTNGKINRMLENRKLI